MQVIFALRVSKSSVTFEVLKNEAAVCILYQLLEHKVKWSDWFNPGLNQWGYFCKHMLTCSVFAWLCCAGFVRKGRLSYGVCIFFWNWKRTLLEIKKHQIAPSARTCVFNNTLVLKTDVLPDTTEPKDPKIQRQEWGRCDGGGCVEMEQ